MELPIELNKYEHIPKEGRTATYPDDQNTALTGGGDGLDHSGDDDLGAGENNWASRIRRDEIFLEINQENSPQKKLVKRKINELREETKLVVFSVCFACMSTTSIAVSLHFVAAIAILSSVWLYKDG